MRRVSEVPAIDALHSRVAELADLDALGRLAWWDQQTMMPRDGVSARVHQVAALSRLIHELATADEIGGWLDELESDATALSPLDRDIVRVARRDWDRQRRVPTELVVEIAEASVAGQDAWQAARAAADFPAFAPALRRNIELARAYSECFDGTEHPYDGLLEEYDFGMRTSRLRTLFAQLADGLPPLLADLPPQPDLLASLAIPIDVQKATVLGTLRRLGVNENSWRLDVSPHPFSESLSRTDSRVTTRYEDSGLQSLLAALHEFGHALYERQVAPELDRTGLGGGTSMSIHESQSKFWENHVGAHRAFAPVLVAEFGANGYAIDVDALHAAISQVRPSLIRVAADQVTYPLHIVLRFELEVGLIEGTLDVNDLPAAWNDGMQRLLGIKVPNDAVGVLQDIHWAGGDFGYFPCYALGCLIAAQLWEQLETDLGSQDEALATADVGAISGWLADRVHRHGRRLDTEPLLVQATGQGLTVEPFLRHVAPLVEATP
jgi:carboxypeptidase Taq